MIIRTEINSTAEAARDFRVPEQTLTPDGQPVRPAANSVEGLREMGLLAPGRSDDVERTINYPNGSTEIIRVRPVTRVIRDTADNSITVFTAFYPDKPTLQRVHQVFSDSHTA